MGSVFRKTVTKQMPHPAEIVVRKGQQFVRWTDPKGKTRTARLAVGRNGEHRIAFESRTYVAKYRDGSGIVRVVSTGCKDETAARSVLAELERRAELVRAKVLTPAEEAASGHVQKAIAGHVEDYLVHLAAKGTTQEHRDNVKRQLDRLIGECGIRTLLDLDATAIERWLVELTATGMSARTRNTYLAAVLALANWSVREGRMIANPLVRIPKADEKASPRRQRRSMSEADLHKLLAVARERPLLEAMTIRRGRRRGQALAKIAEETRIRLERLGWERALMYKTLVLTGLRRGELAALTVGDLRLDESVPLIRLKAANEKNRQGSDLPLRADLASDLRQWLAAELERVRTDRTPTEGDHLPSRLPASMRLFRVPNELVKIMNRDLKRAGIAKRDDFGRVLDVHALRHTFGTLLSKGGVAPRTAQAAMRHSDIGLTMNVYTDPRLLDVRGALNALPALSLETNGSRRHPSEGDQ